MRWPSSCSGRVALKTIVMTGLVLLSLYRPLLTARDVFGYCETARDVRIELHGA